MTDLQNCEFWSGPQLCDRVTTTKTIMGVRSLWRSEECAGQCANQLQTGTLIDEKVTPMAGTEAQPQASPPPISFAPAAPEAFMRYWDANFLSL